MKRCCWFFALVYLFLGVGYMQEALRVEPYSLVELELKNVWASDGESEAALLTDTQDYTFGPGSYIFTDENGEGWIQLIGEDNRRCGWVYVFQVTRLTHAPCSKSAFTSGSAACMGHGTTVFNNKCEGDIYIETPSATIQPQGTYFAVTYLPDKELSLVQMYEGQVQVWPVLDTETRVLGNPDTLPTGFFWFNAPDQRQQSANGLLGRELHSLETLAAVIEAFNLEPWQERVVRRAQADHQDVPESVAATVDVSPIDRAPYLTRPDISPRMPSSSDMVIVAVSARDSDLERIEIRMPGEPLVSCSSSPCTARAGPFAEGEVSFQMSAFDSAGNSQMRESSFRVRGVTEDAGGPDGTAPAITRLDLSPAQPTEGGQVTLVVEAVDDDLDLERVEVYANGVLLGARPCSDYQCVADFILLNVARETQLELKAFDQAGNETVRQYRLEASPPPEDVPIETELALEVIVSPPEPTFEDTVTLSAVLSGASEGVERIDILVNDERLTSCETVTCQAVIAPAQFAGTVTYRVEASDRAGRRVSKDGTLLLEVPILAKADLIIESLDIADEPRYDESGNIKIPVTVVVRNQGNAVTEAFQVAIALAPTFRSGLSQTATINSPYTVMVSSDPVAPGAVATLMTELVLSRAQHITQGTLAAWADACTSEGQLNWASGNICRVDESDEENNTLLREDVVLPNLSGTDPSDTQAPRVRLGRHYECHGSDDNSLCAEVVFSEPMAQETVTASASLADSEEPLEFELEWLAEGGTVKLILPYYPCSGYVVTLQGRDLANNRLSGDTQLEFSTFGCVD